MPSTLLLSNCAISLLSRIYIGFFELNYKMTHNSQFIDSTSVNPKMNLECWNFKKEIVFCFQ